MKYAVLLFGFMFHLAAISQSEFPYESQEIAMNYEAKTIEPSFEEKHPVYFAEFTEKMPEFPGGINGLNQWISKNIDLSQLPGLVEGTLYARLIVEKTGEVSSVKILKGLGVEQDLAVLNVLNKMPGWLPGIVNGSAIKTQYDLPIKFINK